MVEYTGSGEHLRLDSRGQPIDDLIGNELIIPCSSVEVKAPMPVVGDLLAPVLPLGLNLLLVLHPPIELVFLDIIVDE